MEFAKRMVLVDEKWLADINRKQDSNWRKPTEQTVKNKLNRQMKIDLDDASVTDDVKMKNYNQDLTRFLNTKRKLPIETVESSTPATSIESTKPVASADETLESKRTSTVAAKVARSKPRFSIPSPSKRVKRLKRAPRKFIWEQW